MNERGIVVPGARPVRSPEFPHDVMLDRRGRPLWEMPDPDYMVGHRRSAADPRTRPVPVYRGVPAWEARRWRSQRRRAQRGQVVYP